MPRRSSVTNGGSSRYVLDSFAVISLIQNEAGAKQVDAVLQRAKTGKAEVFLSVVNYAEALYTIERDGGFAQAQKQAAMIAELPLVLVDANRGLSESAARFKAGYRVSLADAFALALAQNRGATVLTGDPEFRQTEAIVPVEWLPR
jgi:uncharacterized protein